MSMSTIELDGMVRPTQQAIPLHQHGPRPFNNEGSQREVISGLNRTASARTVYASPAGLLAESDPQRSDERFLQCLLHRFLLPQASWRSEGPLFVARLTPRRSPSETTPVAPHPPPLSTGPATEKSSPPSSFASP